MFTNQTHSHSQTHHNNHNHNQHQHNLSINSISSLIEPTTPPTNTNNNNNIINKSTINNNNNNSLSTASTQQSFLNPLNKRNNSHDLSSHHFNTPISTPNYLSSSGKSNLTFHNRSLSTNSFNSKHSSSSSSSTNSTSNNGKSVLWDSSNKLNQNLNLPFFSIDNNNHLLSTPLNIPTDLCLVPGPQNNFKKLVSDTTPVDGITTTTNSNITTPTLTGYSFENDKENKMPFQMSTSSHTPSSSISTPSSTTNLSTSLTPPVKFVPHQQLQLQQLQGPKIDKDYLASISKVPLSQLKSEILKLAKDQYGCRFLQKKIDENLISNYQLRLANFEIIFQQIYPFMYELIIDPFGNYLIQKLISFCDEDNLNLLLEILQTHLFQISINQHGTRALQKIIDQLNNQYQLTLLIKGLKPFIIELIKDLNGNHVIQKILNKYQPIDCQFIYDSIIQDLYIVATHKHGCCVLQKCLNHVTINQLQEFSNSILKFQNFKLLINDQFGNYVLQYLISLNSIQINYKIHKNFCKYGISNLCNLKFSSNVVEKFLKNCYNNEIVDFNFANLKFDLIYQILINDLNILINDPFGNYVIQTLIDILISPQINYYKIEKLNMLLPDMDNSEDENLQILIIKHWFQNCKIITSYGKRIQSKINSILNQAPAMSKKNGQMNANGEFKSLNKQNNPHQPTRYTSSPSGQINDYNKLNQQSRNFSLPTNFYSTVNNSEISVSIQPSVSNDRDQMIHNYNTPMYHQQYHGGSNQINYTINNQRYTPPMVNPNYSRQCPPQLQPQQNQGYQKNHKHAQTPSWSSTSTLQNDNGPIFGTNNW